MKTDVLLVIIVIGLILLYFIYKNKNEKLDSISDKPTLGIYYTNWCGYSRSFLNDLDNGLKNTLEKKIKIKLVDCEKNKDECAKLNIQGYPSIILHTPEKNILYKGNRSEDDLIKFIDNSRKNSSNVNKTLGVYYTEWCGYSRSFLKELDEGLQDEIQKNNVNVKLVDCEKNKEECAKLNIQGFPSIILHSSNGDIIYNGDRSKSDLINFVS
jgi:thiol-disulfide isomerase/thioredoxin